MNEIEQEYNKNLITRYPFLRPENSDDYSYTKLDEMPIGWRKAFGEQMCEEIVRALKTEQHPNEYKVLQIKEKWGYLHWYDAGATDEINCIVNKYEKISSRTCVRCGAPATKISKGWTCPWCDNCAMELQGRDSFECMTAEPLSEEVKT